MSDRHLVTCDKCGDEQEVYCGGRGGNYHLPQGWTSTDAYDYCEDCTEELAKQAEQDAEAAVVAHLKG